jgi:hypothetical protein
LGEANAEVVFFVSEVVGLLDAVETVDVIIISNSSGHSLSSDVYIPLGEADVEVVFFVSEAVGLLDAIETTDFVEELEAADHHYQ